MNTYHKESFIQIITLYIHILLVTISINYLIFHLIFRYDLCIFYVRMSKDIIYIITFTSI